MNVSNAIDMEGWTDFSGSASPTGFTGGLADNMFYYSRIGKIVNINFSVSGTSNAATLTFTVPFVAANHAATNLGLHNVVSLNIMNSGALLTTAGLMVISTGTTTAGVRINGSAAAFTASGIKGASGFFSYKIA